MLQRMYSQCYMEFSWLTYNQVFAVKARLSYPFGRRVIANKWNFAGIIAGACLGMFIVYTPPLHVVFGGTFRLSPLYWLIPVAFGIVLLAWSTLRVVILRKSVEHMKVKDIKGLMMCKFYLTHIIWSLKSDKKLQSLQWEQWVCARVDRAIRNTKE